MVILEHSTKMKNTSTRRLKNSTKDVCRNSRPLHFPETEKLNEETLFVLRLLLKLEDQELGRKFEIAGSRFINVARRLHRDEDLYFQYDKFIRGIFKYRKHEGS